MSRILVVEDEQDLAELLRYNLNGAGFEVEVASLGATALSKARTFKPDLITLDLMLPDISGHEVLRVMKADPALAAISVVMVTAKGQEADRIQGFELGADDYVVKPFSPRELLLRVRAVLRRLDDDTKDALVITSGPVEIDAARHEVKVFGKPVTLTALEFRLLKTLAERPDRVQTREVLLCDVWGIQVDITTRTVDTHIKRLREKLGLAGEKIETIRGVGYKMIP